MAYIQGANPFSRRKGKAKREAKKQLKSLYKQGYSDITRTTQADGSVSYAGAGEKGPEQKLDRRSRRNIRQEARGDKMTNDMNIDQKGPKTTEVKELGVNRMSSSPLHQDQYDWEVESGDPRTGGQLANPDDYVWDVDEFGNETREKLDDGRIKVQQSRNISGTHTGEKDDDWWGGLSEEQKQVYRDRQSGTDTRTRYVDPVTPVNEIPPSKITTTDIGDPIPIIPPPVIGEPSGVEEPITIGSNQRVKNEKVPVTTTKDVERRKPGMQKVCTNWEWVERGSGQGESRSDAGPRPTVTKTKTKTRMRRI